VKHELYDIWFDETARRLAWKVQLIDYVAGFETEGQAQRYVTAVKAERKKLGLK
jgi:predicted amidohydrolase